MYPTCNVLTATGDEPRYIDVVEAIKTLSVLERVKVWVVQYDRWMSKRARIAEAKWRLKGIWEDLKQEMIIEAYAIGQRYNPAFGTTIEQFLAASLWHYAERPHLIQKYRRNKRECFVANTGEMAIACPRKENSLHEDAANVFSQVKQLTEYERILIELKYRQGYTFAQIDETLGLTRGGAAYRVSNILAKIKVKGDGDKDSD